MYKRQGEYITITGNQTGVILLDYLIGAKQRTGKMPENPVALKTIVTTEMARKVAETNGLKDVYKRQRPQWERRNRRACPR